VSKVSVSLEYRGRNKALLVVQDDAPEGFRDLTHAFTLFAESAKKTNPEQRGRFNLGEKLVLAMCDEVTIRTTKAAVYDLIQKADIICAPSKRPEAGLNA
jgi:hypothetical protein